MKEISKIHKVFIKIILIILISGALFFSSVKANEVYAQYFKFELVDPSKQCGDFQVKILINTAGVKTINGDTLIVFDNNKLNIESAQTGNFYNYFMANPVSGTNNKYLITSWEESVAHAQSSTVDTLFATLNLKAKAAGSTNLSFLCDSGRDGTGSHINRDSDSADILKCNLLQPLTLSLTGASCDGVSPTPTENLTPSPSSTPLATPTARPTSTPVPTSPPAPTNTPRPTVSQLPRAGIIDSTLTALGLGSLLTIVGILFML